MLTKTSQNASACIALTLCLLLCGAQKAHAQQEVRYPQLLEHGGKRVAAYVNEINGTPTWIIDTDSLDFTLGTPLTLSSEFGVKTAADAFVDAHKAVFGLDTKQLGTPRISTNNTIWFVRYPQVYGNHRVWAADLVLSVRNNGTLVGAAAALFPKVQVNTTPSLSSSAALQIALGAAAVEGVQGRVKTDLVIVPMELENAYAFGLAWEVVVYDDGHTSPLSKTYLIDAHSGKILEEYDNIGGVTHVQDEHRADAPIASPVVVAAPLPLFQYDFAVRKRARAATMPATPCSSKESGSKISGQVSLNYHETPNDKNSALTKRTSQAFPGAKYSITGAGSSSFNCTGYADSTGAYAATVPGPGSYTVTFTMENDVAFVASTVLTDCDTSQSFTLNVNGPTTLNYDWGWGRLGEYGHTAVALNGLYHAREMDEYYSSLEFTGLDGERIKIRVVDRDDARAFSGEEIIIQTGGKYGRSSDIILHEYGHAVQYKINNTSSERAGRLRAIREGTADFFAADKTDHSLWGGPAAGSDGPVPWRELNQDCPWLHESRKSEWDSNLKCRNSILSTTIAHYYKQGMALAAAAWEIRSAADSNAASFLMTALQMSSTSTDSVKFRDAYTKAAAAALTARDITTDYADDIEKAFAKRRMGGPNMPDELEVDCPTSGTGSRHLQLEWSDNSVYESGYVVERKEGSGAWRQIANLTPIPANTTNTTGVKSYEDTGVTCPGSAVYYYRVAAYKSYTMPDETISTYSVAVNYPSDGSGGNSAQSMVSLANQVIGLQSDSAATRTETSLDGAYPNPFNPITTVRFSLAEAGPVRLRVYDVLGRRVAVLANSDMAAGAHSVKFEAAHLPSGMYLLRLETARQHWTHWVSLVK